MSRVLSIADGTPVVMATEPDSDVVSFLERAMTDAKNGRIRAIIAVCVDGAGNHCPEIWGQEARIGSLIGLLEIAKVELINRYLSAEGNQ